MTRDEAISIAMKRAHDSNTVISDGCAKEIARKFVHPLNISINRFVQWGRIEKEIVEEIAREKRMLPKDWTHATQHTEITALQKYMEFNGPARNGLGDDWGTIELDFHEEYGIRLM